MTLIASPPKLPRSTHVKYEHRGVPVTISRAVPLKPAREHCELKMTATTYCMKIKLDSKRRQKMVNGLSIPCLIRDRMFLPWVRRIATSCVTYITGSTNLSAAMLAAMQQQHTLPECQPPAGTQLDWTRGRRQALSSTLCYCDQFGKECSADYGF